MGLIGIGFAGRSRSIDSLARMFDPSQPVRGSWVLKNGYALEMRFHMAP
jgi:hypothetical protein